MPPTKRMNDELFEKICIAIETTRVGISKTCREFGISDDSFYIHMRDRQDLQQMYAHARAVQADILFDTMRDVAENCPPKYAEIQKAAMIIDVLKFVVSKLQPQKYGTKIEVSNKNPLKTITAEDVVFELATNVKSLKKLG